MLATMITAIFPYGHDGTVAGLDAEWWWFFRPLMLLLLIIVIAVTIRWVFRFMDRRGTAPLDRAREILAERYARGEISSEEYGERLGRLR
jgi:putative membrane protein